MVGLLPVANVLGRLLSIFSSAYLMPIAASILYRDGTTAEFVAAMAISLLGGFAFATLRDWERQKSAGASEPHFVAASAGLPRPLEGDIWAGAETPVPSAVSSRRSGEAEPEVVGAVE